MQSGRSGRAALVLVGLAMGTAVLALEAHASDAVFRAAVVRAAHTPLPGEPTAFEELSRGASHTPTSVCLEACRDRVAADWPAAPDFGKNLRFKVAGALGGLAVGFAASRTTPGSELAELEPVPWWRPASVALTAAALVSVPHKRPDLARGRWTDCNVREARDSLNGIDRVLRERLAGESARTRDELAAKLRRRAQFARVSDATLMSALALPLGVIAGSRGTRDVRDVVVYGEVQVANAGLLMVTKRFFGRPRPYAHFCEPGHADALREPGAQFSFFSGHASLSFAGAMSAARLAQLRGHRNAGAIKWTGLGLASTTALLRVAGDKHYFVDVFVGAGVGLALGHFIPKWQAPRARATEAAAEDRRPADPWANGVSITSHTDLPTPESALFRVHLAGRARAGSAAKTGTWLAGGLADGGPALALHLRF